MLLLQKKSYLSSINRFISFLFDLRLIKDKYRESSTIAPLKRISRTFVSRWRECTREEACQNKFHALRELTLYEVRRAAGRRAKGLKLIRGAWNPAESLRSVEDVKHVARFLIIAPRMEQALARSVARGVRWDVRDIRGIARRDRVMVIKKVFLRVCGAQ